MSISGKIFVLGEYAVLAGLPAVVAAVPPRFRMKVMPEGSGGDTWPEGSPVGRYLKWAQAQGLPRYAYAFEDPLQGAGGLGASTAQFALAYFAHLKDRPDVKSRWSEVWKLYRELMKDESVLPSGADLVAQWQGGIVFFDPSDGHCQDVWPLFDWSQLLVFTTTHQQGRKVRTHEHLKALLDQGFPHAHASLIQGLEQALIRGIAAIQENQPRQLGQAMNETAQYLAQHGLEVEATREDRRVLSHLPGVLGVKGAGALQSDAVLVLLDSAQANPKQVIEVAEERGLKLLCDGLGCQMGVACQV